MYCRFVADSEWLKSIVAWHPLKSGDPAGPNSWLLQACSKGPTSKASATDPSFVGRSSLQIIATLEFPHRTRSYLTLHRSDIEADENSLSTLVHLSGRCHLSTSATALAISPPMP